MNTVVQSLQKRLSHHRVEENKDISPFLTMRTKTLAGIYTEARTRDDIIVLVQAANQFNLPLVFVGGGSNIAVLEEKIDGIVAKNFYISKETLGETGEYADVLISSGYPMSRAVTETVREGLSGFEYHLGLPGTIGGAIYMNSKWTRPVSYVGDYLLNAQLVTAGGEVKKVGRDYFKFAYDFSILQDTKEIVLDAVFRLKKADPQTLARLSKEALAYRQKTQPFGVATCGCFFRNLSSDEVENGAPVSAGYYIDKAGLKNKQIGGFTVSERHANFIINKGGGKPEDLKELVGLIKDTVYQKYKLKLREEVVVI